MALSPITTPSPTQSSDTPLLPKTTHKGRCAIISDLFNQLMSKIATSIGRIFGHCVPSCLTSRVRQDLETPGPYSRESSFSREDSFFYDAKDN